MRFARRSDRMLLANPNIRRRMAAGAALLIGAGSIALGAVAMVTGFPHGLAALVCGACAVRGARPASPRPASTPPGAVHEPALGRRQGREAPPGRRGALTRDRG